MSLLCGFYVCSEMGLCYSLPPGDMLIVSLTPTLSNQPTAFTKLAGVYKDPSLECVKHIWKRQKKDQKVTGLGEARGNNALRKRQNVTL